MSKKGRNASKDYWWSKAQLVMVKIDDIKIGDRVRQDHNVNIQGLVSSIEDVGMLQPPLVDMDLKLVCGGRRITALKKMGVKMLPVIRAEVEDPLLAQMAENTYREGWTPEERMACIMKLSKNERYTRGNGSWTKRVGQMVGLSGGTVHKAFQVLNAGEKNPKKYGALAEKLRRTGNVDNAFQRMRTQRSKTHGIKTEYNGVSFRSLTEARWAALFDMKESGIDSWKYEPYELVGWIPDFEISIGTQKILVEAKADTNIELLFWETEKIENSGVRLPVWKVGGGVFAEWPDHSGRVAGLTRDFSDDGSVCWKPFVRPYVWMDLWKRACHVTQWKGK